MENVVWGEVPAQRTRKQEKYTTPVVTMSAVDKPGAGRKFSFNRAAQEALGIQGEDRVSFGFESTGKRIFIRKAEGDAGFQLTKTCTLSDKKTYEFIVKRWDLNSEVETELDLVMGESYGELFIKNTSDNEIIEFHDTAATPAEVATLDAEADHDVDDIAEYVPMDVPAEEEIEDKVTEAPFDTDGDTDEDVW